MKRMSTIILIIAALTALPVSGQSKGAKGQAKAVTPSKPTPRMPDGKPDLSGFWQGPLLRNMFEAVGGPPFTPAGEAAYHYNMTQSTTPKGSASSLEFRARASVVCRLRSCNTRTAWRSCTS